MNKTDLIAKVVELTGITKKDAGVQVDAVFQAISEALENGDDVAIGGFGKFVVKERAARIARNPKQPEQTIEVPAKKVPTFKPAKQLKDSVK